MDRSDRTFTQLCRDSDVWGYTRDERKTFIKHLCRIAGTPQREQDARELKLLIDEYNGLKDKVEAMRVEVGTVLARLTVGAKKGFEWDPADCVYDEW